MKTLNWSCSSTVLINTGKAGAWKLSSAISVTPFWRFNLLSRS